MNLNVPFTPQPKPPVVNRKAREERKAKQFRDAVWRRDQVGGWRQHETAYCARCKLLVMRGEGGEIDHIKPRSTHTELKYDPSNGRIVCHDCQMYFKLHPLEREP